MKMPISLKRLWGLVFVGVALAGLAVAQPAAPSNATLFQYLSDVAHLGFPLAVQNLAYTVGNLATFGSSNVQSGTTYTLSAADCGQTVIFTNNSGATVTIPATIVPASGVVCVIAILQAGSTTILVNGSAVAAASLVSANSYTGTSGTTGAIIDLTLTTVSGAKNAYLSGTGS